ncbi:glycosyltransferase family 2 protein [Oceanisphaera psychrotolerans]|uniref:glycosyltransferase family 2 protein n=1 Tax=Oceanisphaera psychrotolerans TaxID=1414654 RepID=UPI001C316468|nr:glycosyltransferase [Oceanisphaera psychrotolerans]
MKDIIKNLKVGDAVPVPPEPRAESEIMANWKGDLSQPLVSIVCHTYNHVNYIKDALNGFLMQETDFPFEIIVHDDASTDGTTEIVKEYVEIYSNIIVPVIQSENKWSKGVMPRSFTFPKVRGKYIALCEGDDYWVSASKLKSQVSNFKCGVSLVFHDSIRCENFLVSATSYYNESKVPVVGYKPFQMRVALKHLLLQQFSYQNPS